MNDPEIRPAPLAYENEQFLNSPDGRILRVLSEYVEPLARFRREQIQDTVVFFGSARVHSRDHANERLTEAHTNGVGMVAVEQAGEVKRAQAAVDMSRYYEDARQLARLLTEWSIQIPAKRRRFVVTTGGGPGIMEAANLGARDAGGKTIGLNINLPFEQVPNPYITPSLNFEFHYFFMRKFWFAYLAKAVIVFPGGYGTLDELFELLTLVQTRKMTKPMPIVLFGTDYWRDVVDFDALARHGMISPEDTGLVHRTDSVDDAYDWIVAQLSAKALAKPGATL